MSFRSITSILALSLIASTTAFADNDKIPCPAIGTIQQVAPKVDAAELYGSTYIAYTSNIAFTEDNRPWLVGVVNILASSINEALTAGKNTVKNTSFKKNENAIQKDEYFYCLYGKGDIVAVTGNFGTDVFTSQTFKNF